MLQRIFVILIFVSLPTSAWAQSYRVHSQTQGRVTQVPRFDGTLDAQRTFQQRLSLSVYDATGSRTGAVNGHVGVRYFTDFGLTRELRLEEDQGIWWNYIVLDSAYVEYNPWDEMRVRAGRQFQVSSLGMRDFDGATVTYKPRLAPGIRGLIEAFGGRDVQFEGSDIDPDAYDVQGVGFDSDFAEADGTWLVGGRAGLSHSDASFDFAYTRRDYDLQPSEAYSDENAVGEERFGVAAAGNIYRDLNISAQSSYNVLLKTIDNGRAQLAWRVAPWESVVSMGVEHRVPWFDSGSIWNIFGAQPRQGAFLTYQHPVAALRTSFEFRTWGRIYHGDADSWDWGAAPEDETAYGAGLGHSSEVFPWGYQLKWRTFFSGQTTKEGSYGGDQLLLDSSVSANTPGLRESRVTLRGLGLYASTSNWRREDSGAITGVFRFDWPTQIGELAAMVELSHSSDIGGNSRFYVVYEVEAWP